MGEGEGSVRDYKLKSEVGYKLSQGMTAVGNQCKDCVHATPAGMEKGKWYCAKVRALVSHNGTCRELLWRNGA